MRGSRWYCRWTAIELTIRLGQSLSNQRRSVGVDFVQGQHEAGRIEFDGAVADDACVDPGFSRTTAVVHGPAFVCPENQMVADRGDIEVSRHLAGQIDVFGAGGEHFDDHHRLRHVLAVGGQAVAAVEYGVRFEIAVADRYRHAVREDFAG